MKYTSPKSKKLFNESLKDRIQTASLRLLNDAVTLDDNDPKVEAICGMFVSQELLTWEDVESMKEECLSPYQG